MNFNIGDWVVKVLELIQTHKSVKIFCYWILVVVSLFALAPIIQALTYFILTVKGY
ncbi:hypothetical protein [Acinetobacter sp. HY1485]|uniref:hypothetical protein n=1 Tax=Acinetobacter sp. HY1485 TaxID=2970918 RepID=UPI0022B99075|nr:hypothetical protein [Acinetobacter sp. HY1485]